MHEFEGNKGETLTLLPVLDAFRQRHQATEVVVVADAGMLSASNVNRLEDAGFSLIVGSRTSSAPYDLAEHYETVGNIVIDGETVETTRIMGAGSNARR
ncbi:transposase [Galbitalea sp. SE-J8]|uniref:transposase n=1 Tax=Galbitalea sp. SE-J8 TaxID=3054952 RepID=UPI00259C7209|nr:transposase [Galbitalea sp. SE-J8]MDM4764336.1 transposase [Galbitalea sp. SE-J8]